jgi:hypothetical protein
MKSSRGRRGTLCRMTVFLIVLAISAPVAARVKKHNRTGAQVVGHIQFKDKALVDMALTTGSGRLYLYLQHSKDEGVSILDVTDPSQPTVLETTFWPEGENLGQFTFLGDYAVGEVLPCSCSPLGSGEVLLAIL